MYICTYMYTLHEYMNNVYIYIYIYITYIYNIAKYSYFTNVCFLFYFISDTGIF